MPEMPEVETIRRSLEKKLLGRQIQNADIILPRQVKWPDPVNFAARVTGRRFVRLERSGKYLIFILDNDNELIFHLRMTGRLLYQPAAAERDAYTRLVFELDDASVLLYADTRTFGAIYALTAGERWRVRGLAEMGLEPLSEGFTPDYLQEALKNRKTKIKSFLLDQRRIGGLGNIYADEALFLARIHPLRLAGSLDTAETFRLYEAVNEVIRCGIEDGGTTFRDYVDGNGDRGHHQERLQVYHRQGLPCRYCSTLIEKITVGGRGTHFCPQCQPAKEAP